MVGICGPASGEGIDLRQLPPVRLVPRRTDRRNPDRSSGSRDPRGVAVRATRSARAADRAELQHDRPPSVRRGGQARPHTCQPVRPCQATACQAGQPRPSAVGSGSQGADASWQSQRLGAAVTLFFCQGWRVSEVLGLAWEDLDLVAGTAHLQRGAAYTPSARTVLGPTKTSGAEGASPSMPRFRGFAPPLGFPQVSDSGNLPYLRQLAPSVFLIGHHAAFRVCPMSSARPRSASSRKSRWRERLGRPDSRSASAIVKLWWP